MEKLRKNTIRKLIGLMNGHRKALESSLESTGVFQGQHRLLMVISDNPNCSQKELADKMEISTATIAVSLKKLEKGGYVARATDSNDTRYNQVVITENGKKVVEQSKKIFRDIDERMFRGFTEEEINVFAEYVSRLSNNIKNYNE